MSTDGSADPTPSTAIIAGRYRGDKLVMVGRTVPLTAAQAAKLVRRGGENIPGRLPRE